jgi:uncharacterized protein YbjT (DUF2867 family)
MTKASNSRTVFVTGGTGYVGGRLIGKLIERGHSVRALARAPAARKLPAGCTVLLGDALDQTTVGGSIASADTFVHLIGVPRPAPWKGAQVRAVDLPAVKAAITAAQAAGIVHFLYVSVAQPAPVMKAYIEVRAECEAMIRAAGLQATILRPWYILGPGHYWPAVLWPAYWVLERLPATRAGARRLGLVTIRQMIATLVWAIEYPAQGVRVMEVPMIRSTILTDH